MRKLMLHLDDLRVESFVTDALRDRAGTVVAHDSEACREMDPDLIRRTHEMSCFVDSCNAGSCFDCSNQMSCWDGCNTPLCGRG